MEWNFSKGYMIISSMEKHPAFRALLAEGYILLFALCVNVASSYVGDTELGPLLAITLFLSIFVLSAAFMAYCFVAEPALLAIAGKSREALRFFSHTVLWFVLYAAVSVAVITLVLLLG
jgi:hypothetical protein